MVQRHIQEHYRNDSLFYKTLEKLQQSKGWENLWFLTINTVGTGGEKSNYSIWRTIWLKNNWLQAGHQQTKSWNERKVPSYQRHGQKCYPQRKTVPNVAAFQYEISLVTKRSTTWLPAATQASASRNQFPSLFLPLSSQQVLVVSQEGVPQLWSYTSRRLSGCRDLGGKSLNLCLPALREGHSLFSQWCAKYKILFYFSSCQFSRGVLHFDLRQQLNSSFLQPRCFLQHGDRKRAGSEAGRLPSPCAAFLSLPLHCALPLPQHCSVPCSWLWQHKHLWGPAWASTCSVQNTHTTRVEREEHTGCWGEEKGRHTAIVHYPCYGYTSIGPFPIGGKKRVFWKV